MRNRVNSAEINELIAKSTGIEYNFLNELYEESIRRMKVEKEIKDLAESLKLSGKKIGIVTDNMDVFTKITIPNHRLNTLFDIIINSADYGLLKKNEGGRLFDIALAALEEKIGNSLMIDDSESTIELYKQKGGQGFVYKNPAGLKSFLRTWKIICSN
jgi:FMN phosphatase YigB (HAD superfamily)